MREHHLQVLQLPEHATPEDIKAAYRALSKQYHPDLNADVDAHEKFLKIKAAYEYLTDDKSDDPLFDYFDPHEAERQQQAEQDAWRAEARRQAKAREEERIRYQHELIRKLVRGFAPIATAILLFNLMLVIDYYLPYELHEQEIVSVSRTYEEGRPDTQLWYDVIVFEEFTMRFERGNIHQFDGYEYARVEATSIFRKPMTAFIAVEGQVYRYQQLYNVFIVFGYMIPGMLLLTFIFFYVKQHAHRLNIAIVLFIFSIIQLFFFFGQ